MIEFFCAPLARRLVSNRLRLLTLLACAPGADGCLSAASDTGAGNTESATLGATESTTSIDGPSTGPADTAGDGNTRNGPGAQPVPYTGPTLTKIGRFDSSNPNVIRFGYAGSRLGMAFTGTSLGVTLADTGQDDFNLFIDGTRYALDPNNAQAGCLPVAEALSYNADNSWGACLHSTLTSGAVTTTLAKGLSNTTHTAWFEKRTENLKRDDSVATRITGITALRNFVLDSNGVFLKPPSAQARRMLFTSDSGFTGLGASWLQTQAEASACGYISVNQDPYLSIPAFVGRQLNADIVNVACSGKGIYDSVLDADPNHTLPHLFEQVFTSTPVPAWDFSQDGNMDVVVIGGGGLDLWGNVGSGVLRDPNAFVFAYTTWLARIREVYPNAFIVSLFSPSAQGNDIVTLRNAIQTAITARNAAGDTNLAYFWYFTDDPNGFTNYNQLAAGQNLGYACSGHPSGPAAQVLARRLSAFVKQKKGW